LRSVTCCVPAVFVVWLRHALLLQRLVKFLKQGQEMLGVQLLGSFGGDNPPGTSDFLRLLQVTPAGRQYVSLTLDHGDRNR
jgi:hypothetical protein